MLKLGNIEGANGMKVIGYVRVSTDEQAATGVSLAAQREKLTAYAALYGLRIVDLVEDAGQSAKSLKRPGLQRALELLEAGEAQGLLIAKLDRLSRSVKDWNALIDGYFGERGGFDLFSVGDSIDTRSAAGRLVLNVLMSVGQWEREAIGERTRDALRHKRNKGQRISGRIPFGYRLAEDGVSLVEEPTEQAILREIDALRAAGLSLRKIAAALNREGVPTKEGGPWQHTTIRGILTRNVA
jgi:DNA invertase Pin-like site-specific DNA recombinase